jgi:UDP-N-acetylglucosamine 2-epimerase (non-hydrolysing)
VTEAAKVICVIGTRPEAIKMAPVIHELRRAPWALARVVVTGQHRDILRPTLFAFGLEADIDLDIMETDQSLAASSGRLISGLGRVIVDEAPAAVLAQGDTSTTLMAALSSFYARVPFGHVEAGLRTGHVTSPFPEEINRVLVSRLAAWHFAPTASARDNLLAEGVDGDSIFLTGNSVIDALLLTAKQAKPVTSSAASARRMILVTAHRRESFGAPLIEICRAIAHLAASRSDVDFLFPVHPNPNVRATVAEHLTPHPRITCCEPLAYGAFVEAMQSAFFILTDSGGIQEEAPALRKPVLVLREQTERPEAVAAGVARIVGTNYDAIVRECSRLLDDAAAYDAMASGASPYGDGHAAKRIVQALETRLAGNRL